jgi:hypothetical protein
LARCRPPIYLRLTRTSSTVVHCPRRPVAPRPLSSPARSSSPIVAHCPRSRKRPAVPESNSLALPRTSVSIVLPRPVPSSCAHLLLPSPRTLPVLPLLRPSSSNKGEVGEVRRSRANHCLTPPCFRVPRCIVQLVPRRRRSPKIGDVRYGSVTIAPLMKQAVVGLGGSSWSHIRSATRLGGRAALGVVWEKTKQAWPHWNLS